VKEESLDVEYKALIKGVLEIIKGISYFDTAFSLTSIWHSDVAYAIPRDNERENAVIFDIPLLRHMCVFQNYKQRTSYLNWANHLVFSPLRHVCFKTTHNEPLIWTELTI